MVESIWGRKNLIGGKHLGKEIFNWMENIWGRKDLIGWKSFGGGKI